MNYHVLHLVMFAMPRVLEFWSSITAMAFIVRYAGPLFHPDDGMHTTKYAACFVFFLGIAISILQIAQFKRR
jgi:hypothetical protein